MKLLELLGFVALVHKIGSWDRSYTVEKMSRKPGQWMKSPTSEISWALVVAGSNYRGHYLLSVQYLRDYWCFALVLVGRCCAQGEIRHLGPKHSNNPEVQGGWDWAENKAEVTEFFEGGAKRGVQ